MLCPQRIHNEAGLINGNNQPTIEQDYFADCTDRTINFPVDSHVLAVSIQIVGQLNSDPQITSFTDENGENFLNYSYVHSAKDRFLKRFAKIAFKLMHWLP